MNVQFFQLYLLVLSITARAAHANVSIVLSSASGNVTVRSTILLVCVAGGSLTPEVTWQFNGSPVESSTSAKHTVYNTSLNVSSGLDFVESILEICDIGFDDGGQYTCNSSAQGASSNTTTTVTILELPIQVNITGTMTANENELLVLNCTSSASATLSWFKRGDTGGLTTLLPTPRISTTFWNDPMGRSMAYSILTVRNVMLSDSGIYVCVAENNEILFSAATVHHTFHVNAVNECHTDPGLCRNGGKCTDLDKGYQCTCTNGYRGTNCEMPVSPREQSKPKIRARPANQTIDIATPINLSCSATGNPPPAYQWYKDGEPVPGETRSNLYIAEASPEDRGNYYCIASNSHGNSSSESEQAKVDIRGILQYTAHINFSEQVSNENQMLLMIINSNLSSSSVYTAEILNSSQRQMFILLITLVNVSVPSSTGRSATLRVIEASLKNALRDLPPARAQTVAIQRYDGCNPKELNDDLWPETAPGSTVSIRCPCTEAEGQLAGRQTRTCEGTYSNGANWGSVDDTECRGRLSGILCRILMNISLNEIETAPIPQQISVSQVTENITSQPENLTAADISTSATILAQLTTGATTNTELRDSYLQIIDNIQMVDAETVLTSQDETNSSAVVLQSLQKFQDAYLASNVSDLDNKTVFTFNTFAINIQEVDTKTYDGHSFNVELGSVEDTMNIPGAIPANALVTGNDVSTNTTVSVHLPSDLFMSCGLSLRVAAQTRLSYSVFISNILFQNKTQLRDRLQVGSVIIAPRVQCNEMSLTTPITVSFRTNRMIEANSSRFFCGSWNTGSGAWLLANSKECTMEMTSNPENKQEGSKYTAKYGLLSHFGMLFDLNPRPLPRDEAIALTLITYIGLVISVISLTIFLISHFSSKKLRTSVHNQILINMSLALIGLYIFFVVSGHVTFSAPLCGVSSALLQYFILVFLAWTVVEEVWLYLKLVKVLGVQSYTSNFLLKAGIPAWAVPLLVVIPTAGPGHKHYYQLPYCRAKEWPFYAGTIAPFILVYLVNWIMFIIIMVSICKHTKGATHKKGGKVESIKKNIGIALMLATIFGLGWGIGLAATSGPIKHLTFTFQILFSLLVGLQGTLIFLLHGVRNKDMRDHWKQCFTQIGGKSLIVSLTKTSSAGHQSLNGTSSESGTMSLNQKKPLDDDKVARDESGIGMTTLNHGKSKEDGQQKYTTLAAEENKHNAL